VKLDLKALFGGDTQRIAIEEQLDFHDLQYGSYCPLRQPVRVTGQAYAKADVCYLDLDLSFVFATAAPSPFKSPCRCPYTRSW